MNLTMAEMTAESATMHSLSDSSPPTVPRHCSTSFTQVAAQGSQGGSMEAAHLRFSWAGLHVVDDVSRSVLSVLEDRFLICFPASRRRDSSQGGPSSTGSSHAGGNQPPAAPRRSAATPPTPPRRTRRSASAEAVPAPSTKSMRALRSQKLQTRLARAHEAAVVAMMEEDTRATVVKPHYVVVLVDPHALWPDGDVVVYAQFPFLLNDSRRTPGLCLSYCRKVLCDPDPRSLGGTYEAIFTMEKAYVDQDSSPADDDDLQGAPDLSSSTLRPHPAPTQTLTTPADPAASGTPSVPAPPPGTSDEREAASLGAGGPAELTASDSTDQLLSTGGSASAEYDGLDEETLDELPLEMTLVSLPHRLAWSSRRRASLQAEIMPRGWALSVPLLQLVWLGWAPRCTCQPH